MDPLTSRSYTQAPKERDLGRAGLSLCRAKLLNAWGNKLAGGGRGFVITKNTSVRLLQKEKSRTAKCSKAVA